MLAVYGRIGVVCEVSGDLLTDLQALMDALDDIRDEIASPGSTTDAPEHTRWCVETVGRIDDFLGALERRLEAQEMDETIMDETDWIDDVEMVCHWLAEFAPPYCFWARRDGQYGYWVDDGLIEMDHHDGALIVQDAGDEWPADEILERAENGIVPMVMTVTDHGNRTLWTAECEEVWSVV